MKQPDVARPHARSSSINALLFRACSALIRRPRRWMRELYCVWALAEDDKSRAALVRDFVLYRVLRLFPRLGIHAAERTVRVRGGIVITYRLNRGDIQSIREIFLDQAYRLPFESNTSCIVDLGANIGLTSVWLAKKYRAERIIAVEPDPSNAKLVRRNLSANGIEATVIEAAVGSVDKLALFSSNRESNLGKIASTGRPIKMISMPTLLGYLAEDQMIDVLKLDIEGGEQDLLAGDLNWLKRVGAIIAEFHPKVIDYRGCIRAIEGADFAFVPANSVFTGNMDAFVSAALDKGARQATIAP